MVPRFQRRAVPEARSKGDSDRDRRCTHGKHGERWHLRAPESSHRTLYARSDKEGFSKYVQTGIVLQVASNPAIDVALKVGTVSEQVTRPGADAAFLSRPTIAASEPSWTTSACWSCR